METEKQTYRIAVDCMGGDKGPGEVVQAVSLALKDLGAGDKLFLVGQEEVIRPLLCASGIADEPRVEVRHAPDVIEMDDKPMQAMKSKKHSSMIVALEMLKAGEVDAVVSTGNTKVLVGAGTIKVRLMPGVQRPALSAIFPRKTGYSIVVDVGANPETTSEQLVHNSVLGALYSIAILGTEKPKVGLLTVGTEEGKGGERINRANAYLKALNERFDWFEYAGPVEGFDVFQGDADVIVTDGFTGNILLKTVEGLVYMLKDIIGGKVKRNPIYIAAGLMLLPLLRSIKKQVRPEQFGGAPLLGLNGLVFKAHGSSNKYGTAAAITIARHACSKDINKKAAEVLSVANDVIAEVQENF
ncbi:MAG: phosphate acyltransferase PlsX [Opitutales bacterium]|nr:phosphate acyltransferase PlsX [Opitutales bacterium]